MTATCLHGQYFGFSYTFKRAKIWRYSAFWSHLMKINPCIKCQWLALISFIYGAGWFMATLPFFSDRTSLWIILLAHIAGIPLCQFACIYVHNATIYEAWKASKSLMLTVVLLFILSLTFIAPVMMISFYFGNIILGGIFCLIQSTLISIRMLKAPV